MGGESGLGSGGPFRDPEYAKQLIDALAERESRVHRFLSHIPGGKFISDFFHPRVVGMQDDLYVDDDHALLPQERNSF